MSKNTAPRTKGVEPELSDEDVQELLPWYASGKTTEAETAAIARRLANNPALQAELKLVRQEKQVSVDRVAALGAPSPDLLAKMLGQLDGARQLPPLAKDAAERAPGLLARLFGFASVPALRVALAVACLVIVAESAALLQQGASMGGSDDQDYQTASAPTAATGPQLIVRFQPDAGLAAVSALIGDLNAGVVKGPMPDGAYVIALPQGADVNAAMTALRSHADLVAGVDQGS
jgi:hypothetical protein